MNITETRDLLGMMELAWPNFHVDGEALDVWAGKLAPIDPVTAHKAADLLVDVGSQWPPTLSQMVDTCRRLAADAARTQRARRGTCGDCDGTGWIEVGHDRDANRVIPCQACLPATHERWQTGRDGYSGPVYTGGRPRKTSDRGESSIDGLHHARDVLANLTHPTPPARPTEDR